MYDDLLPAPGNTQLMISNLQRVSPILLFLIVGCSGQNLGKPANVQGKITLSGKPQDKVTVSFIAIGGLPAEHKTKTGTTNAEGQYTIKQVYPAEYMVTLQDASPPILDPAKAPAEPTNTSPFAKYGGDSPLRALVAEGKTTFDFDVTTAQ